MIQKDICEGRGAWGERREGSQQRQSPQREALTGDRFYPARDAPEHPNRDIGT